MKFLVIFEHRFLHFHWALGPTNDAVSPVCGVIYHRRDGLAPKDENPRRAFTTPKSERARKRNSWNRERAVAKVTAMAVAIGEGHTTEVVAFYERTQP